MPAKGLTRLGLLAMSVGLGVCGCDSSGGSSPAIVEKKEDLEKRENTIKELYKAKKSGPIKNGRRGGLGVGISRRPGEQVG